VTDKSSQKHDEDDMFGGTQKPKDAVEDEARCGSGDFVASGFLSNGRQFLEAR
jgi:hypothetical protein